MRNWLQQCSRQSHLSKPAACASPQRPQAESLKYKLLGGLAVRRACYGVLRFIMESGAKGAEVRGLWCVALAFSVWAFGSSVRILHPFYTGVCCGIISKENEWQSCL